MKKFLVLSLLMIFIFCSCGKADTEKYKKSYSADFEIEYRGYTLKGDLKREQSGISQMTLNYPDDLKGLNVIYENGDMIISYKEIVLNADDDSNATASFADIVFNILDKIAYNSDKCNVGKNKIEGKTENGNFEVELLADGGLKALSAKEESLTAKFKNFSFEK